MNKTTEYILKGVKVLIILVGIFFTYRALSIWQPEWGEGTDVFGLKILADHSDLDSTLGLVVNLCKWLIILTFAAMLIFWIVRLVSDFKAGIPALIGIVAMVIIAFIAFNMAGDVIDPTWSITPKEKADIVANHVSKKVGAGIYMAYILGIITIAAIVFTEVRGLIK